MLDSVEIPPHSRFDLGNRSFLIWDITVGTQPYQFAWDIETGNVFVAFEGSKFHMMGERFSPQHTFTSVIEALRDWIDSHGN